MTETLSFPGLGLSFEINRVAFTVAGQPVYWYGILIAVAFLAGAIYATTRTREFGLDSDRVMDVVLGGVLCGIIGARLYYVFFSSEWPTYRENPISILYIRSGGLAIYGGIIGAVLAAVIICRWRKVSLLPLLDLVAGGLLLGQSIGRWGNFVNMEAFGSNTTAPWGMTSSTIHQYLLQHQEPLAAIGVTVDPSMPVHPTFFYESLWCFIGFVLVALYTKKRRFDGELSLLYLGWYGLGRFCIEGLRTDSLMIGSLRVSQLLALLCVLASVLVMVVIRSRIKREGDPNYMPLYVNTDEGKAVLAGQFYKKKKSRKEQDNEAEPEESPQEPETDGYEDEAASDLLEKYSGLDLDLDEDAAYLDEEDSFFQAVDTGDDADGRQAGEAGDDS